MNHAATVRRQIIVLRKRGLPCLAATTEITPTVARQILCPPFISAVYARRMSAHSKVFSPVEPEIFPRDKPVEEENLPNYKAERYFTAYIGQILRERYQIVGKLGYGGGSTVWACRDLRHDMLVTLKICTTDERGTKDAMQEVAVSDRIKSVDAPHHPGKQRLRTVLDSFEIEGSKGNHQCLVFTPLAHPLTTYRKFFPGNALETDVLRLTLLWLSLGLDFLHQVGVVHIDLSPNNILVSFKSGEEPVLKHIEEHPTPCKVLPDRSIYLSYELGIAHGPVVIADYGATRLGDPEKSEKHSGDVMPGTRELVFEVRSHADVRTLGNDFHAGMSPVEHYGRRSATRAHRQHGLRLGYTKSWPADVSFDRSQLVLFTPCASSNSHIHRQYAHFAVLNLLKHSIDTSYHSTSCLYILQP